MDTEDPFNGNGDENDDIACIYCNDMFSRSRSKEIWLKCNGCDQWCHAECAGVDKKNKKMYLRNMYLGHNLSCTYAISSTVLRVRWHMKTLFDCYFTLSYCYYIQF